MHHLDITMDASFWLWRTGLHSFSSIEKRVIQLFIAQQDGEKSLSIEKRGTHLFIHRDKGYSTFHPSTRGWQVFVYLRRGFHTFHPSNFHPLRRGLHKFSSTEERVTKLFIHQIFIHWEECYTTFHPSTRRWRCRSWTFEQLAMSVNQNNVIGYQKYLSWHFHASAISGKWWPLVGYLVHHCAELHQQYIQNVL